MSELSYIELSESLSKRLQRHLLDAKYSALGLLGRWLIDDPVEKAFDQTSVFCCFVGHGRSGGTVVGALLNAHPNVVMSNELNALRRLRLGMSGRQLMRLIYLVSARQVARGSRGGGGYTYAVPNQWQGKHREILVIGDRKAGATAHEISSHPESMETLRQKLPLLKKFVHVARNPFDTITTTFHKTAPARGESLDAHLMREVGNYFARCEAVRTVEETFGPDSIHYLYHERLIADPPSQLRGLCGFLGIEPYDDYLNDCASIIRGSPHQSHKALAWPDRQLSAVRAGIARFHWLSEYAS